MNSGIGSILLEKEILLESGTNEVEVLVFRVGAYRLGINVAKVREVLAAQTITELPRAHPSVVGCFRLRDIVVPCVSLRRHLDPELRDQPESNFILTEFNHSQTAFAVDAVERIHRINWEHIQPAPAIVTDAASPVTAVTILEGQLVIMLDFEAITAKISNVSQNAQVVENRLGVPRESLRVLVADDSHTVRSALAATLRNSGYRDIICFEHGRLAWEWIQKTFQEKGDVRQVADILVSDVEMPAMDGLHLTRNIKEHPQLRELPVVLYSSILTPDNHKKGKSVGADAQITKPELARVVELADEFAMKRRANSTAQVTATNPPTVIPRAETRTPALPATITA
ncbi:MAG: chemotaxis protein [Pirellulales bacterium]|nr:chemotaxis protein [Pirellulales bacterium]